MLNPVHILLSQRKEYQRWIESLDGEQPANVTNELLLPKGEGRDEISPTKRSRIEPLNRKNIEHRTPKARPFDVRCSMFLGFMERNWERSQTVAVHQRQFQITRTRNR